MVLAALARASGIGRARVTSIRRVQNIRLWTKFQLRRHEVLEQAGGAPSSCLTLKVPSHTQVPLILQDAAYNEGVLGIQIPGQCPSCQVSLAKCFHVLKALCKCHLRCDESILQARGR